MIVIRPARRSSQKPARHWFSAACILTALSTAPSNLGAVETDSPGVQIYGAKCATCHGSRGEGGKKHKRRLEGDRSIAQLAELIAETMPEDDPGSLSAQEAGAVAAYMHDAFYSPVARERNRPAKVELARLTVGQYRRALADLIGTFREPHEPGDARGLNAEYFSGRRFREKNQATRRVDAQINFDFGIEAPLAEITEPHEFSIRWNGSVVAPETGEYEFVVRTEHAARLWVNDINQALIDAWVKSGNDTEYRASMYLIGARAYPMRLEFSKAKQGVDDSKTQKEKPPSARASVVLLWKRPQGALEPIPSRQLSPAAAGETFVCATAFPPDDRSYGWERGTGISKAWDQATTNAALEAAGYVAARVNELAGTSDDDAERAAKLRTFCEKFTERAFRWPLDDDQLRILIDRERDQAGDTVKAIKRMVLSVLKSPRFLYREVAGGGDGYDTAARLSFGLWDSIPDQKLLASAAQGRLASKEQVAHEAERMLTDPRGRAKLHAFLLSWLKVDAGHDLAKDPQEFPGFDAAVIADLRTSLELFVDDVIWSDGSDFRQLLLADSIFLNGRLAKFYARELPLGGEAGPAADFIKLSPEGGRRAGVLTHPYVMATFAHGRDSSPIHRGLFLARGMLGRSLRPPPEAVVPLLPELHPTLTTRERVSLQTQATACMSCHGIINPLGFTLEHFDAIGRYRETDRDKPVDARGEYTTRSGEPVAVNGARELAEFLAASEETYAAFVEQLFHHFVQQPVRAYGLSTLDELRQSFVANELSVRKLVVEVMVASARTGRQNGRPETANNASVLQPDRP